MMTFAFESEALNKSRMDDYFTTTIVGPPEEVSLGKAFTSRMLQNDAYVTIDALTAKAWLSEPARAALKQRLKQANQDAGIPYPAEKFARSRRWSQSPIVIFLLGFAACAVLSTLYAIQPWLRLPFIPFV
jgi:hypothetical protein